MDDVVEEMPLYRALLELAGTSTPALMKVLTFQEQKIGRVFPVLMNFCAEVISREVAQGSLAVSRDNRGFEAGDRSMRRLSGKVVVYFLDGYARRFHPKIIPKELSQYVERVSARLMEAARRPFVWSELTEQETVLLEPVGVAMLRNRICNDVADPRIALPNNLLQSTMNFIVWWGRSKGRMPTWYRGRP